MSNPVMWGNQIRIDGDIGSTYAVDIAALATGKFVATWSVMSEGGPYSEVHAQIFNADGSRNGAEFTVSPAATEDQNYSTVAALPDGGFVIAWEDSTENSPDLVAEVFDSSGHVSRGPFLVSSAHTHWEYLSHLAARPDGGFVAAWQTYDNGEPDFDAKVRVFNANGLPSTADFQVNPEARGFNPSVAVLTGGRVAAAWDGSAEVHGRIFNADGTTASAEFALNTTAGGSPRGASLTALANGGFAAVWQDTQDEDYDVYAQVFDANGGKSGAEIVVNTTITRSQFDPAIAQLADGRLVVAWTDDSDGHPTFQVGNIRLQVLNLDGIKSGDEMLVTLDSGGYERTPSITALADGRFVVSWDDHTFSASGAGLGQYAQIVDPREGPVHLVGTPLGDDYIGTAFDDNMEGRTGNDRLDGAAGNDTAIFSQDHSQYTITAVASGLKVAGPDGTDLLFNFEFLQFTDGTFAAAPTSAPAPAPTPAPGPAVDYISGLFDTHYYLTHYADVSTAKVSGIDHFNTYGWHEGRDPNAWFDTALYLAANQDIAASGANPLEQYHQAGWKQGRNPGPDFDNKLYLLHNPDVAAAGIDPLEHYLQHGMSEGRQIYAAIGNAVNGFDAEWYVFHNPDVAAAGVDPLWHYNTFGLHEGRDPNPWFDTKGYLEHYADVAAAGLNPLQHYEQYGWIEGRDPSAAFDTGGYLAANPDVAAAHINPLDHFLNNGIYEGRAAINDGLWH